ncbi:Os12g0196300, partial [Oryza sativa Japonica Group]
PLSGTTTSRHSSCRRPTPSSFDNAYFTDLLSHRVLLRSDQEPYGSGAGNGTMDVFVRAFAANATTFEDDFAVAMERPGNLSPLNGKNGERRGPDQLPASELIMNM